MKKKEQIWTLTCTPLLAIGAHRALLSRREILSNIQSRRQSRYHWNLIWLPYEAFPHAQAQHYIQNLAWPLPPWLQMISLLLSIFLVILSHPCIPDYLSTKCVVLLQLLYLWIFLINLTFLIRKDVKQWLITILSSRPSKRDSCRREILHLWHLLKWHFPPRFTCFDCVSVGVTCRGTRRLAIGVVFWARL